jgi:hypothetical protein
MAEAAEKFLNTLSAEQKAKAAFPFDSPERTNWHFVPLQDRERKPTRKGLRLEEMSAAQREAAMALLKAGTSPSGYNQATTIMSLESLLNDLEKGGTNVRRPDWYFVSIFGTPAKTGKWGWRVEGHHLSINYTLENGQVTATTPTVFGANPATVLGGTRKGLRAIPEVDDLACELFRSLDDDQKKLALQPKRFPEITAQNAGPAGIGQAVGIPAPKLNDKQRDTLLKLIRAYTNRLPEEVARAELGRITQAGLDKVHFAFTGSTDQGKPRTYRVQGPNFVVEFLNEQADSAKNPANHIHSGLRHIPKDFGLSPE